MGIEDIFAFYLLKKMVLFPQVKKFEAQVASALEYEY